MTITAVAQLFLLGSTWVFGLFLFNPHSWVLSYTFTVLNCLQGFFLFLFHCLLNKKVGCGWAGGGGRCTRPPCLGPAPSLTWLPGPHR